jgi:nicotinate phosphoribosyltransferase
MKISMLQKRSQIPGYKKVIRLFDQATGKAIADLITLEEKQSIFQTSQIYHPFLTLKQRVITNYIFEEVLHAF